jgi:hypothetical protein
MVLAGNSRDYGNIERRAANRLQRGTDDIPQRMIDSLVILSPLAWLPFSRQSADHAKVDKALQLIHYVGVIPWERCYNLALKELPVTLSQDPGGNCQPERSAEQQSAEGLLIESHVSDCTFYKVLFTW